MSPCNICRSLDLTELFPDELGGAVPPLDYAFTPQTRLTYRIVKCADCGLIFTDPMPALGEHYKNTVDRVYVESTRQRVKTAQRAVKILSRHRSGGRLLDVGCNTGIFLDAAADSYEVEGIELSDWSAELAARRHKIHSRPIGELNLGPHYDVITMWGVIEHLEDPRRELTAVYDALAPGGLAAFYTGNVDAWLPRLLGKRWWWYQGMHLFYFSRQTLTRLLEDIGFGNVEHRTYRLYFQLFSLANSFNRYRVGRLVRLPLSLPVIRGMMIPLQVNGEMMLIARKPERSAN